MTDCDDRRRSVRRLGDLEAAVMQCLWSAGEGLRVREVRGALASRPLAYTTVMTVLDNLHTKGWVRREMVGRGYVYHPVESREAYTARLMAEALEESADRATALMHFVQDISDEDAALLGRLLRRLARRSAAAQ